MLEILFKDIKGELSYMWRIVFVTVSIFLTTMIYGENVNLQFDCEIPNAVYEYEVGDTVELTATVKNNGKAFETYTDHTENWIKYTVYNSEFRLASKENYDDFVEGLGYIFVSHGYEHKRTVSFVIPEDAPKGEYKITLSCYVEDDDRPENNGYHSETFEGLIIVK